MLMLGFFLSSHTPYRRVRLARFALKTHTSRFTDFFTDFEEKTDRFEVYWKEHNTVKRTCLKHQYYAVKSQYHLFQSPISGS